MPNDVADWSVPQAVNLLTGSAVCTPSAAIFILGAGGNWRRFIMAVWSTDTAGLVTVGAHVGPGSAVTTPWFTMYLLPGRAFPIPFPDKGWLAVPTGQVNVSAQHSVSGATVAYTVGLTP